MSSNEEAELKGGHLPAEKVGGMRVARPRHTSTGEPAAKPEEKKEDEEEYEPKPPAVNPHTQQVVIDGAVTKEDKAFTAAAVKQFHDKPVPTREQKHQAPKHNIQQPR